MAAEMAAARIATAAGETEPGLPAAPAPSATEMEGNETVPGRVATETGNTARGGAHEGATVVDVTRAATGSVRDEGMAATAGAAWPAEAAAPSAVSPLRALSVSAPEGTLQRVDPPPLTFKLGEGGRASRSITLGLVRYAGDWDCARTAMMFLGHQLRERTRLALNAGDRVITLDSPDLGKLPFVYLTGHRDFRFSDAEVANLRAYLQAGGYLWADDSTHFQDETFDRAFRRELARVLPDAPLKRLDRDFPAFRTGYDLSRGYKGYVIPPGDKYRLDYIEGARVAGRVAVVYTRNDYGDGLNIDAHTHPLKVSLTDLSPAEMQEGAVRMGINLTLYFLTHGKGEAAFLGHTSGVLRETGEPAPPGAPPGPARDLPGFGDAAGWTHETWSDAGSLAAAGKGLACSFTVGARMKCAFTKPQNPPLELTTRDVMVLDVTSSLRCGLRLALGLTVGGRYFESRPFYVKPGANVALFPCGERTFKSEAGGWAYRDTLPLPAQVERLTLLVYSPSSGDLRIEHPRVVRAEGKP